MNQPGIQQWREWSGSPSPGLPSADPPACPVVLTLQVVELAGAVLPSDVLPVGAARQGHHGAQGGGPLAHLHLELRQREERAVSFPRAESKLTDGRHCRAGGSVTMEAP